MSDGAQSDTFARERHKMVESQLRVRGIHDARVLDAMARVPRHLFVSEAYWTQAYEDHPLPIDCGQTISQPFIVAHMLQLLELQASDVVLEVGTGSGYQAAVLSLLASRVYSIERHEELADEARTQLRKLNYTGGEIAVGDGTIGLPENSPYDAIIVAAAAPQIPQPLKDQLRVKGRMVVPVGSPQSQHLVLARKMGDGMLSVSTLDACRFVLLIGNAGYPDE